jgi:hypothetical protein
MDGMASAVARLFLYVPDFCLGPLFTILSGLAEKWLITLGQSPSV